VIAPSSWPLAGLRSRDSRHRPDPALTRSDPRLPAAFSLYSLTGLKHARTEREGVADSDGLSYPDLQPKC
jgi:hypothetical protein